jgi:anaerobic selenocysteine-containing dehydrogenase
MSSKPRYAKPHGRRSRQACEGIIAGRVKAFFGLGGNFVRAIPERDLLEEAWTRIELTVQIATKLNHSHLVNGKSAYLLPRLGRTEEDIQASGPQTGERAAQVRTGDRRRIGKGEHGVQSQGKMGRLGRRLYLGTRPEFHDFNARMFTPGGFYRGSAAHERIWKTKSGEAEFTTPTTLTSTGFKDAPGRYRLLTMRSNDQFNTTIYGLSDRLPGIEGTRDMPLINPEDIARAGLANGQMVSLMSDADDKVHREVGLLKVTPFKLPDGCVGSYYPEMNPLIALSHHDERQRRLPINRFRCASGPDARKM